MADDARRPDDGSTEPALRVGHPEDAAAGMPAVASTVRRSIGAMGVRRSVSTLLRINQPDGFDCPGCAWPEPPPGERSHVEFCENGAKALAEEATTRRIGRDFFAAHTVAELAEHDDYWLGRQGRLTEPMVLRDGAAHYEPIGWDDAFALIADRLRALPSPDEAVFYTSGRTSNEAAFLYQLLVRRFGTNNLPDCSNMCHESSGVALGRTIGIGKGTVTLADFAEADLVLVVGQNPGTNHPRMLGVLEGTKRAGGRIVAVNPMPEAGLLRFKNPQRARGLLGSGTPLADRLVQVRVNGDLALFLALNRLLIDAEEAAPDTVLDHEFIGSHTTGFDEYTAALRALDIDSLVEAAGVSRADVEALRDEVLGARRVIVCWAMGLTQHRNSVATIQELVNFCLLRGNLGRAGAGLCPVRGHSNVQGDRTMGIWEKPPQWFRQRLEAEFGFVPPERHGLDTVSAIQAMAAGRASVFFGLGGNFVAAAPDTDATAAALRRCRLTVHVSTKLNRSHVVTGNEALILPCLGRTERDVQASGPQFVTVEDSMGLVHSSRGRLPPASPHLLSEVSIVSRLARHLLGRDDAVDWAAMEADYDLVRDRIARVIPGFEEYNRRVREPGGFALPNGPRDARRFDTPTGKAVFSLNPPTVATAPPGRLVLMTVRSHDQFNTTVYGLDDRYRGISKGRRVVFVGEDDLADLGLGDGQVVDLVSEHADGERRAEAFRVVAYPISRGTCAAYFPEANVLVPLDSTAEGSNTPTSKSVVVRLDPR
jgi:molybdopterin-dependent oxidoreductase alpha subunit